MPLSVEERMHQEALELASSHSAQTFDVCVVTFNSAASIGRLLESLAGDRVPAGVRILDNASQDDTVNVARSLASRLRLTLHLERWPRNLGFPVASNALMKQCDSDVVVLVNPDVELRPGVLSALVEAVASDRSTGVATCRLMTRDGRPQSEPARSRPRLRRLLGGEVTRWLRTPVGRYRGGDRTEGPLYRDSDVECASGALLAFRRDLLQDVGFLDESVFMYLEDIDFLARVRRAGYRIRYLGTSWAWHDSGVSARGHESELYSLLPMVWLTYLRRYGGPWERLAARPILLIICAMATMRRLRHAEAPGGELLALWRVASFRPVKEPIW
jgi:GT2 family glycosyltransferase